MRMTDGAGRASDGLGPTFVGGSRLTRLVWLAGALVAAQGCATGWRVDTAVDPLFAPEGVRSVAVLPWFDWSVSLEEADEAAARAVDALEHQGRSLRVVVPGEASDAIVAAGLAYDWALFLYDRRDEAVADSTVVMRVGDALAVDVLVHITLLDVFQHDGSAELGEPYTSVLVQVEFFDTGSGRLAWAGSCGIAQGSAPLNALQAPPVRQPLRWALDAVFGKMPRMGSAAPS